MISDRPEPIRPVDMPRATGAAAARLVDSMVNCTEPDPRPEGDAS